MPESTSPGDSIAVALGEQQSRPAKALPLHLSEWYNAAKKEVSFQDFIIGRPRISILSTLESTSIGDLAFKRIPMVYTRNSQEEGAYRAAIVSGADKGYTYESNSKVGYPPEEGEPLDVSDVGQLSNEAERMKDLGNKHMSNQVCVETDTTTLVLYIRLENL